MKNDDTIWNVKIVALIILVWFILLIISFSIQETEEGINEFFLQEERL